MTTKAKNDVDLEGVLNPTLAAQMQDMRDTISSVAEKQPLPSRFQAQRSGDGPYMLLLDTQTGRRSHVALHAYRSVREVLNDLFS